MQSMQTKQTYQEGLQEFYLWFLSPLRTWTYPLLLQQIHLQLLQKDSPWTLLPRMSPTT